MASRAPSNLVSLPSLSSSLHTLPQATSLSNVALHPSMYTNRAAESEAKLQKALNKQAASLNGSQPQSPVIPGYMMSSQGQDAGLMMRKKKFTT
ncbi:hypothetical protein D9611_011413 [Ephemerocybe angulata]|uniref:Uncharacterized protein n=2 Tax=Ephemerocybe angulata TaxID=980116 RepID=A0A8H5FKC8_9AGAR|nr:hypothetical protein D9611_011413 [Tulosesus angulatus]KAF6760424.1 hypothetical protein DFP72DRAFT_1166080 [Tulosesus angulatus]